MDAGDDSEAIIVVDDFLADPHAMRQHGLEASYPWQKGRPYPGRNSANVYELRQLDDYVQRVTKQTLAPASNMAHGSFRLAYEDEMGVGGVHLDACHWTCVLYLTLPEHCQGGTDFFRHRASGCIRAPVFPGEAEKLPMAWEEIRKDMIGPASKDPAVWEHTRHVEMRFNRLVLFRPWLWHDAGPGFGDSPETGRLIYVAFYNSIDPEWA